MSDKISALFAYVFSAVLLGVTLWPVFRDPPVDSFPHSNYPMFSRKKSRRVKQPFVRGVVEGGEHVGIPPILIGNEEVLQASAIVRKAVRRRRGARGLCKEVAQKVAEDPSYDKVLKIEVVTGTYDAIDYFAGQTEPKSTKLHAGCRVRRGGAK